MSSSIVDRVIEKAATIVANEILRSGGKIGPEIAEAVVETVASTSAPLDNSGSEAPRVAAQEIFQREKDAPVAPQRNSRRPEQNGNDAATMELSSGHRAWETRVNNIMAKHHLNREDALKFISNKNKEGWATRKAVDAKTAAH